MKHIKDFITEKLKVTTKGIKVDTFKAGDEFSYITLIKPVDYENHLDLRFYEPYEIVEVNDESILYKCGDYKLSHNIYLNSHGHLQIKGEFKGSKTVILKPEEMVKFINKMLSFKPFNPKYKKDADEKVLELLGLEYTDDIDKIIKDDYILKYYDMSSHQYVDTFKKPKDMKDFIDTFYEKYK